MLNKFCKLHIMIPAELFQQLIDTNDLRNIDAIIIDLLERRYLKG